MTHPCWSCGAPAEPPLHCPPAPETAHGFTRLRTGNDAPLDAEIPLIREIITNGEERLDTLKTQVRDLEAALAELVQRRDEAAEHLREHRAILHPLRRAPPELICEIFALAVDTPDDSGNDGGFGYDPPWYLGQICRSWRLWALAYPRLWSHITVPSSPASSLARTAFENLLLRSSNVPLNVCWKVLGDKSTVDDKSADLALAHCRRWITLRIDLSMSTAADTPNLDWLHPLKGCLPSLRRLDVLCFGDTVDIPDVFSVAPSLRQVLLTDWALAYYSPDMQFPWDQITHYRGAFQEATQLDILRAAPKLVQCAISFETPESVSLTPGTLFSITLSHLRRLSIELPRFVHHLTAPLLEELYCLNMRHVDISALLPFVRRSDCLLTKLVITACYVFPDLITALRGLPSLNYLLIQPRMSLAEHTDLFRELGITGTSQDLCPSLHSLVYGVWGEFPEEPFFTMIRSRIGPNPQGSRLTYFRIFDASTRSDIISATRDIRDGGIDADVLTKTEFDFLAGKAFFA
ncbi:hypothetical protein DFH06DRAFT_373249 [Mycena polygramma]|nr:hypothetical protein DFH06DRAFT_373249 [Mycena polygramma]